MGSESASTQSRLIDYLVVGGVRKPTVDSTQLRVSEGIWCLEQLLYGCYSPPPPLPSTEGLNFALSPHPFWRVMFGHIRLLGNFPESQDVGCRCTSLAENSSISLAGSEERIHFFQQTSLLPPPYWKARRPWGRGWLVCLLKYHVTLLLSHQS